jgi:hypothetical protein
MGRFWHFAPLKSDNGIEGEVFHRLWERTRDGSTMHTLRCWVVASDIQPGIGAFITNQNLIDQIVAALRRRELTAKILSTETLRPPGLAVARSINPSS